jgi:hypothetical protein
MADSRAKAAMAERTEDHSERLSAVGQKVSAMPLGEQRLSSDHAFQRLYARLSAFEEKLVEKMDSGFARLDRKLDQLIGRARGKGYSPLAR